MATDDERRRVAESLRWLAESDLPPWVGYTYEAVMGYAPKVAEGSGYRESSYKEYVTRLADLIEPGEDVRCVAEVKVNGEKLERLVHDAVVEYSGVDREALLALAEEMDAEKNFVLVGGYARRIREACGEAGS